MSSFSRSWSIRILCVLFVLFAFVLLADEKKESKPKPERIGCIAYVTTTGLAGKPVHMNFIIESYSTDEEVHGLVGVLKEKGQDGLEKAVEKLKDKGRIAPVTGIGVGAQIIRQRPLPNGGRRIVMVADRPITFYEHRNMTRSKDYPFTVASFDLNPNGEGEGTLLMATKLSFNKDDQLEMEHFGSAPARLAAVKLMK
jgi:hypothetical protein